MSITWDRNAIAVVKDIQTQVIASDGVYDTVKWSADGKQLAVSSVQLGFIRVFAYDIETASLNITTNKVIPKSDDSRSIFDWSPDGTRLLGGTTVGSPMLYLWEASTGRGQFTCLR